MVIALILIVFGTILLLKNTGVIEIGIWPLFWPALIIILGLALIFKERRKKHWWDFFENRTRTDWERWGKELGQRLEEWGRQIETRAKEHPEQWENEFGRKIEEKIKSFFERNNSRTNQTNKTNQTFTE